MIGRGAGWWIGDWLRYGNQRFGERYVRASRITGYDVQTLMNMVYVASRFEPEERREGLSWSHHAEVAAAEPDDRGRFLDMAETERLSVRCLREEVRRARRIAAHEPEEEPTPQIQCPECGCRFSRGRREPAAVAAADPAAVCGLEGRARRARRRARRRLEPHLGQRAIQPAR